MIIEVLEAQGIPCSWRGEEPDPADITDAYLEEEVDGLPRITYPDDEDRRVNAGTLKAALIALAAQRSESTDRAAKEQEIRTLALERIEALVPALADLEMIGLMIEMVQGSMANPPIDGSNLAVVRDIYVYAKAKIVQVRTAPIAAVRAYDPSTDPSFPA
jgi:hypothetical protein